MFAPQLQSGTLKLRMLFRLLHFGPHNKDDFSDETRNYFSGICLLINKKILPWGQKCNFRLT